MPLARKFSKLTLSIKILLLVLIFSIKKKVISFNNLIETKKLGNLRDFSIEEIYYLSNKIFTLLRINSCLLKSLVLREILRKYSFKAKLIIGIKENQSNFESHCWLRVNKKYLTFNNSTNLNSKNFIEILEK